MPNKTVTELMKVVQDLRNEVVELKTDAIWIKRIIIGAASLGFLEKIVSWMVGK